MFCLRCCPPFHLGDFLALVAKVSCGRFWLLQARSGGLVPRAAELADVFSAAFDHFLRRKAFEESIHEAMARLDTWNGFIGDNSKGCRAIGSIDCLYVYTHIYTHLDIHGCTHVSAHVFTHAYTYFYTHANSSFLQFAIHSLRECDLLCQNRSRCTCAWDQVLLREELLQFRILGLQLLSLRVALPCAHRLPPFFGRS